MGRKMYTPILVGKRDGKRQLGWRRCKWHLLHGAVLLEKLTVCQPTQEIPRILWNPKIHYPITSARHLSLSSASSIQSIPPHPTSLRSILILSSHLRLSLLSCLFPSSFTTKTLYRCKWYNIKMDLEKAGYGAWSGLTWLWTGTGGGLLYTR